MLGVNVMDRDVATMIVHAAHRSGRDLAHLVPFIKEHCDEAQYAQLSVAIATVLHEIESTICQPIYEAHPDLARDIEGRVARFGRAF